ncbi:MAG: hypothetical protein A2X25_03810 [Chloroflexi bacterium GWB2_49_20]|nr:MAG: hypothetical protein A2X25_03810 [Chloroflexi bacterium GWB2_49_20]OGN76710.1 MAG: hypothetical protein A2X26_10900 [Chloroflexi bacterium GWC2_49_37]OGN83670.1 MAG: hypothetical protein A2X27_01555 [Chloroflexi bacterium GWD2_49_16]HBG74208.1 hypothetical protein [Anaerolineae bacterium]HCC78975.1 hypothetical protein [Anaerolineae bacterium]
MLKLLTNKIVWVGLLISIISVLANLLFFALTQALGELYIIPLTEIPLNSGPMPVFMVILATFIPAILAAMLYSFLSKIAPNSTLPPFLSVAGTALLVSFGGPLDLPGAGMQTKLLLSAMHIIAAIIIVGGLLIFHSQKKKLLDGE